MKSLWMAVASAALVAASAASAETLTPGVQAGFELTFGGQQAAASEASLSFAAGYVAPGLDPVADETEYERRTTRPRQPGVLPLFSGRFSESHRNDFLRAAGFTLAKPGAPVAHASESDTSGWWGRNWWWVALTGVAAGTVAALAGGGSIENNGVNINSPGPGDQGNDQGDGSCPADCRCVGVSTICSDLVGR